MGLFTPKLPEHIDLSDPDCRVRLRTNRRARRLTLKLSVDGAVSLTVPPGVTLRDLKQFLASHADWLKGALSRQPARIRIDHGTRVPVAGRELTVVIAPGPRRAPVIDAGQIVVRGPGDPGPRVAVLLKALARDRLEPTARHYARKLGRRISRISLRDTTSRWGSCSSTGSLSFSWRLAMTPVAVQDYVAAHEAAHLVELNHSAAYWRTLERIMPDYQVHRGWLRQHGRHLHAYRFTAD